MSAMSDYLENKLIDQIFRGQAYTFPGTIYFALYTAAPSDSGGGTEVAGGNYARSAVVCNLSNFEQTQGGTGSASSGTGGATQNAGAIAFPAPNADWGTVTHWGIFDAASAGNLLFHGALTASREIKNGDAAPQFNPGSFDLTLG